MQAPTAERHEILVASFCHDAKLGQVAWRPHLTFVRCGEHEAGNKGEFRELRLRGNTVPARNSVLRPYANVPSVAR
jgi:hypothetical protein